MWTGDANGKCETLKETGIIGSLRWWYEAIVRGLGGYACDPTSSGKCELNYREFNEALNKGKSIQEALDEQICPACQLFGCTGWKRRFRIYIDQPNERYFTKDGFKQKKRFNLDMIPLYELSHPQKWLLGHTLNIIENYGAIGGRTTRKPDSYHGTSYGLIKIMNYGKINRWDEESSSEDVKNWLKFNRKSLNKGNKPNWFDFRFYWIVKNDFLDMKHMNNLLRLEKRGKNSFPKRKTIDNEFLNFLRGKQGISKKIFSFKDLNVVFGYVRDDMELIEINEMLKHELGKYIEFRTGKSIMEDL